MSENSTIADCSCKIGRNIDSYELKRLDDEIIQLRKEGASLRELADFVNRRILEVAIESSGVDVSDPLFGAFDDEDGIARLYDVISGDDTPAEQQARVRTHLSQVDIDIDSIEANWVSHPTVRSHLNDCLGIETSRNSVITLEDAANTLEWARTRCMRIVEQTFDRLRSADLIDTGPMDAAVTIQVTCKDCRNTYRAHDILEQRSCDCQTSHTER